MNINIISDDKRTEGMTQIDIKYPLHSSNNVLSLVIGLCNRFLPSSDLIVKNLDFKRFRFQSIS